MRKIKNVISDIFSDEDIIQSGKDCLQMLLFLAVSSSIIFGISYILYISKFALIISEWIVGILLVILLSTALFSIVVYLYSLLKIIFRKS